MVTAPWVGYLAPWPSAEPAVFDLKTGVPVLRLRFKAFKVVKVG